MAPGRNDPCPCGSGRKYKKCCLLRDEDSPLAQPASVSQFVDPELREWKETERDLIHKGMDLVDATHVPMEQLVQKYWGKGIIQRWQKTGVTEQEGQQFMAWLWLDWRKTAVSKTFAQQMTSDPSLTAKQRQLLASLHASHMGVYQVVRVEPDRGVELENVLEGGRVFVHDRALSLSAEKWLVCFCRTYAAGPYHFATGLGAAWPPRFLEFIRDYLGRELMKLRRKSRGAGWRELFTTKAEVLGRLSAELAERIEQPPELRNSSGECLVMCKATFEMRDADAFLAALRSSGLEAEPAGEEGGAEFVWTGPGGEGRVALGSVRLKGTQLVFECNSRERLARGAELLRRLGLLELVHSEEKEARELYEQAVAERRGIREQKPREPVRRSPEMQAHMRDYLERYYEAWMDKPIPALDGRTPRVAARSAKGRERLQELIREMEYSDSSRPDRDQVPYDWNKLRQQLGLEAE